MLLLVDDFECNYDYLRMVWKADIAEYENNFKV